MVNYTKLSQAARLLNLKLSVLKYPTGTLARDLNLILSTVLLSIPDPSIIIDRELNRSLADKFTIKIPANVGTENLLPW